MTYIKTLVLFYIFVFIAICEAQDFNIATPTIEVLHPKGFKFTLKDDGYTFVGFRANINKEFEEINEGEIKRDLSGKPQGGQWVYRNRDAKLEVGDIIYYWLYVIKNGKGQMFSNLEYEVTGLANGDAKPVGGVTDGVPSPPKDPTPKTHEDSLVNKFDNTPTLECTVSRTMVQGIPNPCKDALIFSEDFKVTSLNDLKKWDALVEFPLDPDYPFNLYSPDSTVSFEDGTLVITPKLTESLRGEGFFHQSLDLGGRCTGRADTTECKQEASGYQILPPVTTAKLSTRNNFNFKYGRVEVRAKLPLGSWLLPEINLEPSGNAYGPYNYESGLMRIAFVRGNSDFAKRLYGGPVLTHSEPFRSLLLQEKIGFKNWYKDFHNYTMVWRPDGIDFLVDGERYGTVDPGAGFFELAKKHNVGHAHHWKKGTVLAPLDEMFHLTLGLRVGGINDFDDSVDGKPWENRSTKATINFWRNKDQWISTWYDGALKVDSVNVYAL